MNINTSSSDGAVEDDHSAEGLTDDCRALPLPDRIDTIQQAEVDRENEQRQRGKETLEIQSIHSELQTTPASETVNREDMNSKITECTANQLFCQNMNPSAPEQVTAEALQKAFEQILDADTNLSSQEKMQLFTSALDYYSKERVGNKPLWHSTSSYSLRKALEDGLSGGHGNYSGESVVTRKNEPETQKGLSVTHPDHPSAESFQQLFARLSARKEELPEILALDSQQITGKTLPEIFCNELLASLSDGEMRAMLAKRMNIPIESVSDDMLNKMTGEDAKQAFIADFNSRQYAPDSERIKREVLPHISDVGLREELAYESEHPFPCMITVESDGKEQHLTTVSRGERPTHIPFEDFFWDKFSGQDIKEVRVPMSQIGKVRGWLLDKGLDEVNVVPIEVYEVKRVIQEYV